MKSKEEIKKYFENGDKPTQEHFWEWQDSYWHKDEKLPADKIDYDFSEKADLIDGKVPASQLPSYVDDVLEFADLAAFPSTGESGKLYVTLDTNKLYRWSGSVYVDITQNEIDTLQNVVDRGNSTTKPIVFNVDQGRAGELNFNKASYSYYFGNHNNSNTALYTVAIGYNALPVVTGMLNIAIGSYSSEKLTSGQSNSFFGNYSGNKATTGNYNTFVGESSGYALSTGFRNTLLGYSAMNKGNGSLNTVVGQGAAGGATANYGDRNVIIGANAGSNGQGVNNILIGIGAGNGENLSNKLIIHSNTSLSGYSNTSEGIYASPAQSRLSQALITGDFVEKWVKINGAFSTQTANYNVNFDGTTGNLLFVSGASSPSRFTITPSKITLSQGTGITSKSIILDNALDYITVGSSSTGAGIVGSSYFGDNYVDNSFVQKKYVDDAIDNFIPLSGTEVGKPVTGKIEFDPEGSASIESGTAKFSMSDGYGSILGSNSVGYYFNPNQVVIRNGSDRYINITNELNYIAVGIPQDGAGIVSNNYYGDNYEDNSFVQKKYIDDTVGNFVPLAGTELDNPITGQIELNAPLKIGVSTGYSFIQTTNGYIEDDGGVINIGQGENVISLNLVTDSGEGLSSSIYHGDNYLDNSFVQKKYTDQKSSYSNNEEITGGQWIDGKLIYKKTVKFDTIPSSGEIDLTSHFNDIETIISNQMFTEWYAMDVAFAGNQYRGKAFITVQPEMAKIEYVPNIDYDYSMINSFTLTLEYTKRTI